MAKINKAKEARLTAERLRELVCYDPDTGRMTWRAGKFYGREIGTLNYGYRAVLMRPYQYFVHRLAWLYVHGEWPAHQIDHINGNRADNRLCNLREATDSQNIANRSTMTGRKFKGITLDRGKWVAQIREGGKNRYIGSFNTEAEAAAAYAERARAIHGDFAKL